MTDDVRITAVTPTSPHAVDAFLAPFIKTHLRSIESAKGGAKGPARGQGGNLPSSVLVSLFDVPPGLLMNAGKGEENYFLSSGDGATLLSTDLSSAGSRIVRADGENPRGLTCIRCGLSFDVRITQLDHFKTRLHLTNLRRQLSGDPPLTQAQLDEAPAATGATGGDDEADDSSGSESDDARAEIGGGGGDGDGVHLEGLDEEDDTDGGLPVVMIPSKTVDGRIGDSSSVSKRGRVRREFSLREGPRFIFSPAGWAWCFSVSAAALGMKRGDDPWERLDGIIGSGDGGGANRLWAVLILQSGKFAAAVFEGQAVVCHKVFKRYTIRAKRGGSQSSYDSGGRKALSAGATLRRYGEQALREDVRSLLKDWAELLKACRVILTSVPKAMRSVLFDGKDAPLERKDPRLRATPFAVGRPTFEEVNAVHARVTSIIFADASVVKAEYESTHPDIEQGSMSGGKASAGAKNSGKGEATVNEASRGDSHSEPTAPREGVLLEEKPCLPSRELLGACERGDAEAVAELLDRLELQGGYTGVDAASAGEAAALIATPPEAPSGETIDATTPRPQLEWVGWTTEEVIDRPDGLERLMTPLHVAAAGGHVSVLKVLLERGASPLAEDVRGRVPFLLAANKDTRDAFRRVRAAQPERWDWDSARVPEPLTEELEQRQKEKTKEKEKEKKRRAKLRKKAEKERAEQEAQVQKEKKAAEAEERRRRGLAAVGHCDACGKAVVPKQAFSRLEYSYCSTDCVHAHKRTLAADAAERRFKSGGS